MSHCTINPKLGMEHRAARLVRPVEKQKKIAIVGGGPGGVTAHCGSRSADIPR